MGRDKTVLPVRGTVLAAHSALALGAAGVDDVACIGGDLTSLGAAGLTTTPDLWPGEGPLGGILTAFEHFADVDVVVVLAGDLAAPDPQAIHATVAALTTDHDLAAPRLDERVQWLHAAWRLSTARPVLAAAFSSGERAVKRAASTLRIASVDGLDPRNLADIDTPSDLASTTDPPAGELA